MIGCQAVTRAVPVSNSDMELVILSIPRRGSLTIQDVVRNAESIRNDDDELPFSATRAKIALRRAEFDGYVLENPDGTWKRIYQ